MTWHGSCYVCVLIISLACAGGIYSVAQAGAARRVSGRGCVFLSSRRGARPGLRRNVLGIISSGRAGASGGGKSVARVRVCGREGSYAGGSCYATFNSGGKSTWKIL